MSRLHIPGNPRFRLTARGEATVLSYPPPTRRPSAIPRGGSLQQSWATSHGLHGDDWAYLTELARNPLSLHSLGEALAIFGQTRELVHVVVDRLIERGFVETSSGARAVFATAFTRAKAELRAARASFELERTRVQVTALADRRVVDAALREALFRHIVAQRFVDELSRP